MIQHHSDYLSVKGTAKSHLDQEDLLVPFMHHDPSDPRMEVGQKCVPQLFTFITIFILLYYIILYLFFYSFIFSVSYFFIYLFPVTKLSHLSESFLIISPFGFLHYLCIKFPTAARRL